MESKANNGTTPQSSMLSNLLSNKEIQNIQFLFERKDLANAKKYLNEPERKKRLSDNGIVADYLYYQLELQYI